MQQCVFVQIRAKQKAWELLIENLQGLRTWMWYDDLHSAPSALKDTFQKSRIKGQNARICQIHLPQIPHVDKITWMWSVKYTPLSAVVNEEWRSPPAAQNVISWLTPSHCPPRQFVNTNAHQTPNRSDRRTRNTNVTESDKYEWEWKSEEEKMRKREKEVLVCLFGDIQYCILLSGISALWTRLSIELDYTFKQHHMINRAAVLIFCTQTQF